MWGNGCQCVLSHMLHSALCSVPLATSTARCAPPRRASHIQHTSRLRSHYEISREESNPPLWGHACRMRCCRAPFLATSSVRSHYDNLGIQALCRARLPDAVLQGAILGDQQRALLLRGVQRLARAHPRAYLGFSLRPRRA